MNRTVASIMLFIGALLIALFYLRPSWSKTVTQTRENRDLRSLNDELNSLIENRDFLLDTINRISKNDLSRVDEVLPKDRQAAQLLALFESLSGKSGLVLKSIELSEKVEVKAESPGQPRPGLGIPSQKPSGPVREFPISMSMLGTYDSFKNFLGMLERNLRVSDIDNLNFSITGTTDLFSFSLKLKTYYQP
ncbi:MAG: hypothetical protein Q8R29_01485 [bacterium]|nr:hypothetical protein [bacterium]